MPHKRPKFLPKPKLTAGQQAYHDQLLLLTVNCDAAAQRLEEERERLAVAKRHCPHLVYRVGWMPTTKSDPEDSECDCVSCAICGSEFGWWCPASPDHICHYFTIGSSRGTPNMSGCFEDDTPGICGKVMLLSREFVTPPGYMDNDQVPLARMQQFETDDRCLFCGSPRERK